MKILIAGATGAVGRPLVRRLRANQHEVFALTRSPDAAPALQESAQRRSSPTHWMPLR